jgi:hypothetical protein
MKKIHVTAIALLIGLAAIFGTLAATRTASLGTASRHAGDAAYAARVKQLDAFSAKLRQELKAKPKAAQRLAAAPALAPVAPRIVYRRPPSIVIVKHTHHGDDGFERADGGGSSGGGGND